MSDGNYEALFERIREYYRRENWFGRDGESIHPYFRVVERQLKVARTQGREDPQGRYFWTDEEGIEYLHRRFYCYDEQDGKEYILETTMPVPSIDYPPATEAQLRATEQALGFPLPPLLRALYAQVANGGVGPVQGIMGAIGGFEDNHGTIVDAYLSKRELYRFAELAACEQLAKPYTGPLRPHRTVSHLYLELPRNTWPDGLFEFYNHGCGQFSCLDANTGRIFWVDDDSIVFYEANSLEEWLERWLQGDLYVEIELSGDDFP